MTVRISLEDLVRKALDKALELGIDVRKSGSIILNENMAFHTLSKILEEYGVIYTSIKEGFERYPDIIEKYGLKLVTIDPKQVDNGILLYVPRGVKLVDPIYTCLALGKRGYVQKIYNLYVIEDDAEAIATKGCLTLVPEGAHVGVTEAYVGRNAKLHSIMIHNWMPEITVSSITKVRLLDNSIFHSYYVNLTSVKKIDYGVELNIDGENAKARSDMVVFGRGDSDMYYWSEARLNAPGSSAELISRMVGEDKARVEVKSSIVSRAPRTTGHIECQGLQLSRDSVLATTPSLKSFVNDTVLTHEASIGRISEEELEYLMAHGFTEEEAVSIIVRGFVEVGLELIPEKLRPIVENVLDRLSKSAM